MKNQEINVLSLFDGMSCGQIALRRAGIKVNKYFASEIDKHAIKGTQANFPETVQLGNVEFITADMLRNYDIDLIIGGSPCQGFSFAGKQLNFEDPRSKLFFEFVRLVEELKPKYFLLENVRMKKESQDIISKYLGVEPIKINSSLVSAQNRVRLYWTNISGIKQPEDKDLRLKDILEDGSRKICAQRGRYNKNGTTTQKTEIRKDEKSNTLTSVQKDNLVIMVDRDKSLCLDANYYKGGNPKNYFEKKRRQLIFQINPSKECGGTQPSMTRRVFHEKGKSHSLTAFAAHSTNVGKDDPITWRKLTPIECERLQTVPDNYTNHVSNTQRYKMLGNGWTVDVIVHIFNNLPSDWKKFTEK